MPLQRTNRLIWLDAARGLAILAVLSAHTLDLFWKRYADYVQLGNIGVVLFFLISGYIIPVSLERTSLPRFWLRRFFRLFPLYWVAIVLYLCAGMSHVTAPEHVLANLTILQPYFGIAHVNDSFWSLTVEITFYALLTLLALIGIHRATVPVMLCLAGLFLALSYLGARWVWDLNLLYLPICFGGTLWYRYDAGELHPRALLCYVLLVALYMLALPLAANWLVGWLIALGVFGVCHFWRSARWPKFLIWCGSISYSLYLLHLLALGWLSIWGIPLAFLIAGLSYRFIERPMIELARFLEQFIFQTTAIRTAQFEHSPTSE